MATITAADVNKLRTATGAGMMDCRSGASSSVFASGNNGKLTNINLSNIAVEIEPVKNLIFQTGFSYRTLESASPTFSLDYFTDVANGIIKSDVKQSEASLQIEYTPKRKTIGFAVERENVDSPYSRFFINYSHGFKGLLDSKLTVNFQKK